MPNEKQTMAPNAKLKMRLWIPNRKQTTLNSKWKIDNGSERQTKMCNDSKRQMKKMINGSERQMENGTRYRNECVKNGSER